VARGVHAGRAQTPEVDEPAHTRPGRGVRDGVGGEAVTRREVGAVERMDEVHDGVGPVDEAGERSGIAAELARHDVHAIGPRAPGQLVG